MFSLQLKQASVLNCVFSLRTMLSITVTQSLISDDKFGCHKGSEKLAFILSKACLAPDAELHHFFHWFW